MKTASPLLILVASVVSTYGAIDFTPGTNERVLSGVKFQQLIFQQDGRKITYEPPRGWRYYGDAAKISFTPADVPQAQAEIEQSLLPAPQNFDEEATVKLLQEKVLSSLPGNSQNVVVISAEKAPLMINRQETFEIIVSYQVSGVEFQRSVLFLNLQDTQVRFRVTARKQNFEAIHKAFRGSICSWQLQ
jgi:hypothetical protein